jgi:hypothetical protein
MITPRVARVIILSKLVGRETGSEWRDRDLVGAPRPRWSPPRCGQGSDHGAGYPAPRRCCSSALDTKRVRACAQPMQPRCRQTPLAFPQQLTPGRRHTDLPPGRPRLAPVPAWPTEGARLEGGDRGTMWRRVNPAHARRGRTRREWLLQFGRASAIPSTSPCVESRGEPHLLGRQRHRGSEV